MRVCGYLAEVCEAPFQKSSAQKSSAPWARNTPHTFFIIVVFSFLRGGPSDRRERMKNRAPLQTTARVPVRQQPCTHSKHDLVPASVTGTDICLKYTCTIHNILSLAAWIVSSLCYLEGPAEIRSAGDVQLIRRRRLRDGAHAHTLDPDCAGQG